MSMLLLVVFVLVPLLVQWSERRVPVIEKVGAVTICYAIGLLIGNLPGMNIDLETTSQLIEVVVPLSIPLLLFSSDLKVWREMGASMAKSFGAVILAVTLSVMLATWLFRERIEDVWITGSMMMGVYTGGTPNLSAIGIALGVESEVFVLLNAADLLFGGIWLLFLLALGKRVFSRLLGTGTQSELSPTDLPDERMYLRGSGISLLLSIAILAIGIGLSWVLFGKLDEVTILVTITTLGILASTQAKIRNLKGSFGLGNYLLLIFCVAVGSLANVSELLDYGPTMFLYVGCIMAMTIFLHLIFSRILRIGDDAFMISSAAGLFGPAFIAPVAKAIRNPSMIPLGIALALLGFAIGNYCGLMMSRLLRWLVG